MSRIYAMCEMHYHFLLLVQFQPLKRLFIFLAPVFFQNPPLIGQLTGYVHPFSVTDDIPSSNPHK